VSTTILLVEDNPHYLKINREFFSGEGYKVLEADTLARGRELFLQETPALIILDIMLPDGDGIALCEELREGSDVPILFLSAKKADDDIVTGFEAGGDDYLSKPYSLKILLKRVEAILHRTSHIPDAIHKGALTLDLPSSSVTMNGKDLDINKGKEFDVLLFLAKNEDKMFSAEQIYERIWQQPMLGDDAAIRRTMAALRKKLEKSGYTITSEYGKGYVFEKG